MNKNPFYLRNLRPFKRHSRPYTKDEFIKLYEIDGLTITEIAAQFGIGRKKVQNDMVTFRVIARKLGKRNQKGERNASWKGGVIWDSKQKYQYVRMPEHPNAGQTGYVAVHTVVCCEKYGISEIPHAQVVHHIDLDKTNNSPDNLVIVPRKDHNSYHKQLEMIAVALYKLGKVRFDDEEGYKLCG